MKKQLYIFALILFIFSGSITAQVAGYASFYSKRTQGHRTSDGGRYYNDSLTCAHKTYAFGTLLHVKNPNNDKEVIVKVTDRGPHVRNRMIDLSYGAAQQLGIISAGIAKVIITQIDFLPNIESFADPLNIIPIPKTFLQVPLLNYMNSNLQVQMKSYLKK